PHLRAPPSFPTRRSSDLQIFVRVNSGGRALKTVDLALATLSAEWPGVVAKIDAEIDTWKQYWPKIDAAFLVRALAAIATDTATRSEEHTSELQSPYDLVC